MDAILLLALMAWAGYWMCVYVVRVGGIEVPAQIPAIPWTWVAVAFVAFLAVRYRHLFRLNRADGYQPGDRVIYRVQKFSPHPGPRAEGVYPCMHGEDYSYFVRKPWTVVQVTGNEIEVVTPGGKLHTLRADDPLLHRAGLLETAVLRLRWHKTFPRVSDAIRA